MSTQDKKPTAEYGDPQPQAKFAEFAQPASFLIPKDGQTVSVDPGAATSDQTQVGYAERKPKYHEHAKSEVIYRGHNGILVATRPIENHKGEMVEGHYYEIGSQEECLEVTSFQNGAVPEVGINGVTTEAFLAMNIHRLEVLDALFPCEENKRAIVGMKDALGALEERTRNRIARGVEGKHVV